YMARSGIERRKIAFERIYDEHGVQILPGLQILGQYSSRRATGPQLLETARGGAPTPPIAPAAAAPTALSSPSTFTKPEFDGTMYLVFCASVLFNTSSLRITSARSLKKVSAAVETRRIASASALAR